MSARTVTPPDSMRIRHLILVAALTIAGILAALGWLGYRYVFPPPQAIAYSLSPDGKTKLVIYEHLPTPHPLQQSPYIYKITLLDAATGKPLPGIAAHQDNDSTSSLPGSFRVAWTSTHVTVTCDSPTRTHTTNYSAGQQSW